MASAVRPDLTLDVFVRLGTIVGLRSRAVLACDYVAACILDGARWLPLRGRLSPGLIAPINITGLFLIDSLLARRLDVFLDALLHIILPAVTLAVGGLATIARFTRAAMIEVLKEEYVTYAVAAGVPIRATIFPFALRNALIAPVTQLGLLFGSFISGAVAIEAIYDWPGLGSYLVQSILTGDSNVTLALTFVVGVIYSLANIITDARNAGSIPDCCREMITQPLLFDIYIDLHRVRARRIDSRNSASLRRFSPPPTGRGSLILTSADALIASEPLASISAPTISDETCRVEGNPWIAVRSRICDPRCGHIDADGCVGRVDRRVRGWLRLRCDYESHGFISCGTFSLCSRLRLLKFSPPGQTSAGIALTLTYWPFFARTAFSETRSSIRSAVFIEVLEAIGLSKARTVFFHILKYCRTRNCTRKHRTRFHHLDGGNAWFLGGGSVSS